MNKKLSYFLAIIFITPFFFCFKSDGNPNTLLEKVFDVAKTQYSKMLEKSTDLSQYPRTTTANGETKYVPISDWTGGFWPGSLWYVYEYTKDEQWRSAAEKWTASLEKNQFNTSHHDIGFMMFDSYGNGYRITKNEAYLPVLVQSAKSLITRYSPTVGAIQSWNKRKSNDGKTDWEFPVIIDNMMNLELLFFVSRYTKDPIYKDIAIKHAETTMKNHLRADYSSFHLVNYDKSTGEVLHQQTVQGFSDNSQWSRGQGWGIYGFTTVYRNTKDKRFLVTAQKMANFFLDHKNLPEDKVPFWDFNVGQAGYHPKWAFDPSKNNPVSRDASAAALTASALFELSTFSSKRLKAKYYNAAVNIINTLGGEEYLAKPGTNGNFILKNSVGHMQKNSEVNAPLVYADYYFLEALLRYKKLNAGEL
ncbi:MAG: glycoside hydrolase family 88 protein [Pedobacter sp.]|uniref:glycoside hydrolase family 88 protein n=1 Tax=Pedobacter sp. TaxID=1411316 RepID=UPI0028097050|nr:glycoside hydrolase family 88 protein [Pedobacter sp.]MDQ8005872.1 glycoside hydrolase family 88 protein [Pedobacter sp.]